MDYRVRRWILPLLGASLTLIGLYVATWVNTPPPRVLRADFVNAYMGGQILRSGHGAQLYDLGLQASLYGHLTAPFHYPLLAYYDTPSAAVLAAPFTFVGVITAWRAFSLVQLALLAAAVLIAARSAPWPTKTSALVRVAVVAAGIAAFSTGVLFLQGQWSGVFAFGVAMAYRELRRGHEAWGAFWLLAPILAVKPNLAIGLLVFVIGWRGRRMLAGLGAAGAAVLAASLLVGGPAILVAFLHADLGSRSLWPLGSMSGITGVTGGLLGNGNGADIVGFAACAVVAAGAYPLGRLARAPGYLEPALAAAVTLTLLASPHLYSHDLAMLTPASVWFAVWALRRDHLEAPNAMPRRFMAAMGGWIAFNIAAGIDEHAVSGRLVPWFLVAAGLVALMAFARVPFPRRAPSRI